ncbi:MAG: peroxiredoxin [Steroidobacteraceae bacterium]
MSPAAAMGAVTPGKAVPEFKLESTGSDEGFSLKAARGTALVLYFYPRDNTPGCTLENLEFQQLLPKFRRAGVRVLGISRDTLGSHQRFCTRQNLSIELLADPEEQVCKLFDVMRDKNMYGKKVRGIERSTFLIDASGVLRQQWRKVKPEGHAAEVLEAVKAL